MQFTIRHASVDDARAIATVRIRTWQATYRGMIPDAFLDAMDIEQNAQFWRERLAEWTENFLMLVAETDEGQGADNHKQVVGFCACGPERESDPDYPAEIYALYVLPEYQGRGAGKQLVWHAACWLLQRGFAHLLVYVLRDNTIGRRFYEAIGGSPIREVTRSDGGLPLVEVGYGYVVSLLCEKAEHSQGV